MTSTVQSSAPFYAGFTAAAGQAFRTLGAIAPVAAAVALPIAAVSLITLSLVHIGQAAPKAEPEKLEDRKKRAPEVLKAFDEAEFKKTNEKASEKEIADAKTAHDKKVAASQAALDEFNAETALIEKRAAKEEANKAADIKEDVKTEDSLDQKRTDESRMTIGIVGVALAAIAGVVAAFAGLKAAVLLGVVGGVVGATGVILALAVAQRASYSGAAIALVTSVAAAAFAASQLTGIAALALLA